MHAFIKVMRGTPILNRFQAGNPGDTKPVGQGVYELRLPYGPGYRIYDPRRGNTVVLLLCGGDKSSQEDDSEKANRLAAEWDAQGERHES